MKPMNLPTRRDRRRGTADANEAARAARTDEDQISLLSHRPGNSSKEVTRLLARIEAASNPQLPKTPEVSDPPSPSRKTKKGDKSRQHLDKRSSKPKHHRRGGPPGNAAG